MKTKLFPIKIIGFLFLAMILAFPLSPVDANTCLVTNLNEFGTGSLRAAIDCANVNSGPDVITFTVSGTINITSNTPWILSDTSGGTLIDGTTAPSYIGVPRIVIRGPGKNDATIGGLVISSSNNEIRGLQFVNFYQPIKIIGASSSGNSITRSYIGTDGTTAFGNSYGIRIEEAPNTIIGTNGDGNNDDAEGNLISGNDYGISISGSSGTIIAGNRIGTNTAGLSKIPNIYGGIVNFSTANTRIGTDGNGISDVAERNLISGNNSYAIQIEGDNHILAGNYIGTDITGSNALGNGGYYAVLVNGTNHRIGTDSNGIADEEERNVISGNLCTGIYNTASGVVIAGNYIGTDKTGSTALGNSGKGIDVELGSVRIGTDGNGIEDASEQNLISGNMQEGIYIGGGSGHIISGNLIGTDASGTQSLGNGRPGVGIGNYATNTLVGTDGNGIADEMEKNIISGNGLGVSVYSSGNIIAGNFIGTDISGTIDLGNLGDGIRNAGNNLIGTNEDGLSDSLEMNLISGNQGYGIQIFNPIARIIGNTIGCNITCTEPLGNASGGIYTNSTSGNIVRLNTIAYNQNHGILISGWNGLRNIFSQNSIFSNTGLGINLTYSMPADGVTSNDYKDGDIGGNNLQNFPTLISVASSGGITTITGLLNSTPNTVFTLEFFANSLANPSGYGEGEIYLGFTTLTTNENGDSSFSVGMPFDLGEGLFITATATDPNGNTSEFSNSLIFSTNQSPVANDDAATTQEDIAVVIIVTANDTDPDENIDIASAHVYTNPSHGTLTNLGDGSFHYNPSTNYFSADSFEYEVCDTDGLCDNASVSITINPVNDAPVAEDDNAITTEDAPVTVIVLVNDTDVDGDTLSILSVTQGTQGSVAYDNSTVTYSPDANFCGIDSFTYDISDGNGGTDSATVTIIVSCANDQPTAADDNTTIFEDTPTPINVLDNDSDLDGDSLNVDSVTQGTHGSVTFNGSEVTYSPEADYCETDAFSYTVSDGNGGIDIGAVNVVINCVNDTPVTKDDTYITNEDVILNVISPGVLDNDTDVDGDQLTAVWISDPSHGTLTLNSDGSFTFVPDLNYYGSDSFTYQATDGITYSSLATVTITVNPVNDAPAADNDSFSTNEDNVLSVEAPGVLTNDTDVDGNALHAVLVDGPAHGSLTLNADGSFGYSPATNYIGGDSFNYKANDGTADSNVVTVTITVNPVNDAPVAVDDSYSTNEDTVLNVAAPGVLGSDTDADGDALHAVLVDGPAHGSLTLNADGSFSYSPATTYNGGDSFTYQANDGTADSNVATVTITVNPVNDAPVAEDDSYSTDEDTVLNVAAPGVLTSDIDVEGDTLHAVLVDSPAHGSLTLSADGSLSYSPATNYNGSDSFTYQANDGTADSDVATVTIMVIPVNDAPVAEDDHAGTDEDTPVTVMVLVNDTDVDNDVLSILLVTQGAHGSVAHTSSNLTYSPNVNFCGVDSFTYEISDGNGGTDSAPVSIVISCLNDQPTAADDSATIFEDTSTTIYVLENDTDLDGDGLIIDAVTQGGYGTVTNNLNDIAYSPGTNYCGTDTFTYAISDGNGGTDVASVDVIIDCVNDAPVANNDNYTTNGEITLSVTSPGVLGNDPDVDGDTLTAMLISDPSHGTLMLNADGSFTYIPDLNYSGSDSFTYEATDGIENSNLAIVIITVIQMNQPPTVDVGGPYTVQEGGEVTITAIGSDPENGTLIYTWDLDNDGDFDDMAGQSILFSAGNLDGPSTLFISVQVTDNSGLQYTDTAEIDVENVAPILSSILAPVDPYSIGTLINASATYSDPGVLDTHTATWNWGDYSTSAGVIDTSNISGSHIYNTAGVYTITLVVEDDDGGVASAIFQYIVIYDPDGGFVTGGGRITSPAGAYYPDPSLTGRATFGFVARYLKGAKTPTGSTEFQFHVANMNFRSTVYDWLVIAGTRAQFKGTGTINGIGEYAFIITVIDGSPDMFRIKIWDKLTGMIVYDNQLGAADSDDPTTAIDEGSIVIHKVR